MSAMPLLILFALFIVLPLAELYVIVQVGELIGVLPTIALLLGGSLLGVRLLRTQGRTAWRRFAEAVGAGRAPAREVLDGTLVLTGGALLIVPGFISDVLGAALLAPPTRALFRWLFTRRMLQRMTVAFTAGAASRAAHWRRPGGGPAYDVDGTAVDVDRDPRPTPRLGPSPQ
jgi:UPF0716 protein FxsA